MPCEGLSVLWWMGPQSFLCRRAASRCPTKGAQEAAVRSSTWHFCPLTSVCCPWQKNQSFRKTRFLTCLTTLNMSCCHGSAEVLWRLQGKHTLRWRCSLSGSFHSLMSKSWYSMEVPTRPGSPRIATKCGSTLGNHGWQCWAIESSGQGRRAHSTFRGIVEWVCWSSYKGEWDTDQLDGGHIT